MIDKLVGPRDADQVSLGIGELPDHQRAAGRGLGAEGVGSAEAFGLGQRSIHILNAYVEQHPTLVIRAAADPAGMPAPAGFSTNP
jgi:hypothetical protein